MSQVAPINFNLFTVAQLAFHKKSDIAPVGRLFYTCNKHSESIAKAIQVPYRPKQIKRGITPTKADQRGSKVEFDLYYVDTNSSPKIQVII